MYLKCESIVEDFRIKELGDTEEEVDCYVWAKGFELETPDEYAQVPLVPKEVCSPFWFSPAMDLDGLDAAVEWMGEHPELQEDTLLWAHLGRGWMKQGKYTDTGAELC